MFTCWLVEFWQTFVANWSCFGINFVSVKKVCELDFHTAAILWLNYSPHVRKSKTVLDFGFYAMDSGFQAMVSSLQLGLWIPISCGILEPLSCIFRDSKSQDSGYFHKQIFRDSGLHKKKLAGFRNLDSLHGVILCIKQLHTTVSHKQFLWWLEMNHVYVWIINVCMRLWENLTNFYFFLNFLEIPRIFLKANLRSSSKVWNS